MTPPASTPPPAPRLTVTTTAVEPLGSLTAVLRDMPATRATDVVSWIREGNGFVGHGRAAVCRTDGAERFEGARRWWNEVRARARVDDEVQVSGSGLVAVGSFAYSALSRAGAALIVPTEIVGRRGDVWWRTRVRVEDGDTNRGEALERADAGASETGNLEGDLDGVLEQVRSPGEVRFESGSLAADEWVQRVRAALTRVENGELEKVVLARDETVRCERAIDPRWLVEKLAADYARTWVFAVDGLVGATPEMLVRTEKGLVTSRVLAGTIRRSGDDAADLALAATLARSSKDQEEHEYAVRSVADALAGYCLSMNVPEEPFVLHLPNVMHLATDVTGRLVDGAESLQIAESLHPSAAICGTPRADADAMIAELEGMDRGRYSGPVGWTDAHGDGEWAIGLRSGAIDPQNPRLARIYAGCGIVVGSVPEDELAESQAKLLSMKGAFTAR